MTSMPWTPWTTPLVLVIALASAPLIAAQATAPAEPATPAPVPSVTLPPELARVLTDYEKAWQARDAAALAALFAEDGFVLSDRTPPVRGRAAIERHYATAGGALALRALAYATSGEVGYIIGAFSRAVGQPDVGKFTLTLKQGPDRRWLIMSDMDNSDQGR